MSEPIIHSFISDRLPDGHRWIKKGALWCIGCGKKVHTHYNECLEAWIEIADMWFCLKCIFGEFFKADFILSKEFIKHLIKTYR
jgi:hypothetical protein